MKIEGFRWLAGVIAAHKDRRVVGRTRLQKSIMLLQRMGLESDYEFNMYHYGPYSEGLQAEIGLLEKMGLVEEDVVVKPDQSVYYNFRAKDHNLIPTLPGPLLKKLRILEEEPDVVVLELAATYDAFREQGSDHDTAIEQLHVKKGRKCGGGNEAKALALLGKLGLPNS